MLRPQDYRYERNIVDINNLSLTKIFCLNVSNLGSIFKKSYQNNWEFALFTSTIMNAKFWK